MKKLLLCSVLAAFACLSAVQAGEDKTCPAEKAKACTETKAKATDCSACCSKKAITKKADSTAKGASQLIAKR